MRLLLDMNLTRRWVGYLSRAGFEAVHWSAVGHATTSDAHICDHARENSFIVITNDLDFPHILSQTRQGAPSVIRLRAYPLVPKVRGEALVAALRSCETDLAQGAIVTLNLAGKPRARSLPIGR